MLMAVHLEGKEKQEDRSPSAVIKPRGRIRPPLPNMDTVPGQEASHPPWICHLPLPRLLRDVHLCHWNIRSEAWGFDPPKMLFVSQRLRGSFRRFPCRNRPVPSRDVAAAGPTGNSPTPTESLFAW